MSIRKNIGLMFEKHGCKPNSLIQISISRFVELDEAAWLYLNQAIGLAIMFFKHQLDISTWYVCRLAIKLNNQKLYFEIATGNLKTHQSVFKLPVRVKMCLTLHLAHIAHCACVCRSGHGGISTQSGGNMAVAVFGLPCLCATRLHRSTAIGQFFIGDG